MTGLRCMCETGDIEVFILSGNGRENTAPPDKLIIILQSMNITISDIT